MSDSKSSNTNIGFLEFLLIVFIILKLVNVIDWSWWWVLSPLWIPVSIAVIIGTVMYFLGGDE